MLPCNFTMKGQGWAAKVSKDRYTVCKFKTSQKQRLQTTVRFKTLTVLIGYILFYLKKKNIWFSIMLAL